MDGERGVQRIRELEAGAERLQRENTQLQAATDEVLRRIAYP
jgi:hypothetical protein